MLFNTLQFAIFFAFVLLLHRTLPTRFQNGALLVASLVFYSLWIPSYLLLLGLDIVVNYALLRLITRGSRPRLALGASIAVTLGLLGGFKYAALAVETLAPLLRVTAGVDSPIPEVLLPLGISFFSFQILGLAIDVYRREIEAPQSLGRYALFVSFFPQLIAGPILRGSQFLPQLARGAAPTAERTQRGLWLLGCGLAKKVILADYLLSDFVDDVFRVPGIGSAAFHWVAAIASRSRSTTTSRATATWPAAWRSCWDSRSPPTSSSPTSHATRPSSGDAGTSPSPAGSGTTSTSRWGAIAPDRPAPR